MSYARIVDKFFAAHGSGSYRNLEIVSTANGTAIGRRNRRPSVAETPSEVSAIRRGYPIAVYAYRYPMGGVLCFDGWSESRHDETTTYNGLDLVERADMVSDDAPVYGEDAYQEYPGHPYLSTALERIDPEQYQRMGL